MQQRQNPALDAKGPGLAFHPEDALVDLLRELTGNGELHIDEAIAESERQTGDSNRRLLGIVMAAREGKLDRHGAGLTHGQISVLKELTQTAGNYNQPQQLRIK